jgi:alpha-L-fucosidase
MAVNGEAIWGTTASPFARLRWGRCTKKLREDGATLFLHVFEWPADGRLVVPGLRNEVQGARLLVGHAALPTEASPEGLIIRVPPEAPDPITPVIAIDVRGALKVEPILPRLGPDGVLALPAELADIHNPGYGEHARLESHGDAPNIGFWNDARAFVEWRFHLARGGIFAVTAAVASPAPGSRLEVTIGSEKQVVVVPATGGYRDFQDIALGRFTIPEPGDHTITVRPIAKGWKAINLRGLQLRAE